MRLALCAVLAGCLPSLSAVSPAPPGRAARLDRVEHFWHADTYRIELSQGIALALDCTLAGPCEHVKVTSDDPAIAEVRVASLGVLERAAFENQQTAAAVVVVGKSPGTTRLHLTSKDGGREIDITVIAPPPG